MSPRTVRFIDVWLGRPICLGLTMLRKVGGIFGGRAGQRPVTRVLLIKMIEQGATVLAYRAIARAVERFGRRTFTSGSSRKIDSSSICWNWCPGKMCS